MDYRTLSDKALFGRLREMAVCERRAAADFIACLAEADRRPRAVAAEGYSSLFDFCLRDLKLAESTAYQRVHAAREANRRPEILSLLADGTVHLSALCLAAPLLADHPELLEEIKDKSKREVEALVASLGRPRPIPGRIRLLPAPPHRVEIPDLFAAANGTSGATTSVQGSASATQSDSERSDPELPKHASPKRVVAELRFAAGPEFLAAVERLRALLWHKYPAGRLEDVLLEAATDFIRRRDPARPSRIIAAAAPGDPESRHVPRAIRRAVWLRDGGRCAFVGETGRCAATRGLEIDHVVPWALGGRSDDPENLRLLCRAHNQAEAERIFGRGLPG